MIIKFLKIFFSLFLSIVSLLVLIGAFLGEQEAWYCLFVLIVLIMYIWKDEIDEKYSIYKAKQTIKRLNKTYSISNEVKENKETVTILTKEQLKDLVTEKFNEHKDVLLLKWNHLTYQDNYGIIKTDKFENELDYFIKNVIDLSKDSFYLHSKEIKVWLLEQIKEYSKNNPIKQSLIPTNNPYDFEKQCADILKNNGWNAEATQKSGDMGVDVIATKNNIKIVLQCKLYSKPVGNHAVQEINTGKDYYKADYAGVVSNNFYTTSARQLAKNCNVLLLNIEDLPNLYEKLNKN